MTSKESINKARRYLIKKGICAKDGSGEPNVEALFARLAKAEHKLACIKGVTSITYVQITNVDAINHQLEVANEHATEALNFLR